MANNPYVNKVVYGATTIIDITPTTAVETDVAQGKVFFKADGSQATGTASGGGGVDGDNLPYGFFNAIVGDAYVGMSIVGEATQPLVGTALAGLTRIGE